MTTFLHIERNFPKKERYLRIGDELKILSLADIAQITKEDLSCFDSVKSTLNKLVSDGVSWHGDAHLLCDSSSLAPSGNLNSSSMIEILFELVRAKFFADQPSRLQSLFACKTKKQLQKWADKCQWANYNTWEVTATSYFKGDANWLSLVGEQPSAIFTLHNAFEYWTGKEKTNDALWEYLLDYPVKIVRQIGSIK